MAEIYTYGELLAENMRKLPNQDLSENHIFHGPFPSGAPTIFISTCSQLGHKTKIWGGVGKDKFGDAIIKRLERDGIDTTYVKRSDKTTAVAFVAYDDKGEREFIFHINNTAADDFKFVKDQNIPDCFHVMGCSMMASERFKIGIEHAVDYYSSMGSEVSFDPNLRPELLKGRSFREVAGKIMDETTIFLPGVGELLLAAYNVETTVAKDDDRNAAIEDAVNVLWEKYPKMKIINVKLGGDGCVIYQRDQKPVFIPVYDLTKKEPLLDATGAGDTFDATFVSCYLDGMEIEKAGFMASKAGALNVVAFGPMEAEIKRLHEKILPIDDKYLD